jgi:hypothetical protein
MLFSCACGLGPHGSFSALGWHDRIVKTDAERTQKGGTGKMWCRHRNMSDIISIAVCSVLGDTLQAFIKEVSNIVKENTILKK